jgi:lysophospholipid acyltransferase (LPLAT)-like uncharacterized protein
MDKDVPMKLRHPWMIRIAAAIGAVAVWLLMFTMRYRLYLRGQKVHPGRDFPRPMIYAFWHDCFLFMTGIRSQRKGCILISQSADGELIAQVVKLLGHHVARGSSTRGGANGLWEMLGEAPRFHLGVTPDGPRGPRRQVKSGAVYLAARTGLPIVPVGIAYAKAWRARSWDRFAVPYPFTEVIGVAGRVLEVPSDVDREQLEAYRREFQARMDEATALAEECAARKRPGKMEKQPAPAKAQKAA